MSPFRGDISSLDNPHVRLVRSLQDKKRARYREQRYVVEGHKLVAQALAVGCRPALAFFTADYTADGSAAGQDDTPQALLTALAAGETSLWQVEPGGDGGVGRYRDAPRHCGGAAHGGA